MNETFELYGLTEKEMRGAFKALGYPAFRGSQVFKHLYELQTAASHSAAPASVFADMTDLPKAMREELTEDSRISAELPKILERQVAKDGTCKYLFGLADGEAIEAVFMKYEYGNSLCVSSQVGCRMGCRFCASTRRGLVRDLTAAEMVGQVLAAERDRGEPVGHIVIMGIGEPFDNYENVGRFLDVLHEPKGKNMSYRNMTVSTCGLVEKIRAFGDDHPTVNLAISLHAPNDELRSQLMPVNRKWPIDELLAACADYTRATKRVITFEYTVIRGVNDSRECAEELARQVRRVPMAKVNLIPLSPVSHRPDFKTPDERTMLMFLDVLMKNRVQTMLRRSRGKDADAACGQLRLRSLSKQ